MEVSGVEMWLMGESNEHKITSGMTATSRSYHAYFDSMEG